MVIDTSALAAVIFAEVPAPSLLQAIERDPVRLLGGPTRGEASIVIGNRVGPAGVAELRTLIAVIGATDVPFDDTLADLASDAYARWGKGNHRARLNMGDCFTYAVAKRTGEPVLCVGDDFARTDVAVVPLG